jgi:PTH1 family peptidyl-tRNA hydrolase
VKLVVGLGNPGGRYARTRHNVAWRVLDELAGRWRAAARERAGTFRCQRARIGGHVVELLRPLTFMNRAGEALAAWMREHDLPEDLLVVTDDVYLPVGALRLRASGSSGGHRGLESVGAALGTTRFARLRLGVGPAAGAAELREHVLERFTPAEERQIGEAVGLAADAVECWAAAGIGPAMNRFNRRTRKEVPET